MIDGRIGFVAVPHEQGGEAEGLGRAQVAYAVFDDDAFGGGGADPFEQSIVRVRERLVFEIHRPDVDDDWEMVGDAEAGKHAMGVFSAGIGENCFGLGQGGEHRVECGVGRNVAAEVDVVDVGKIGVGISAGIFRQEAAQSSAVGLEVSLAKIVDVRRFNAHTLNHETVDAHADLVPQAVAGRV